MTTDNASRTIHIHAYIDGKALVDVWAIEQAESSLAAAERQNFDHSTAIGALERELAAANAEIERLRTDPVACRDFVVEQWGSLTRLNSLAAKQTPEATP